ncbi:MAG: FHA domain-containing protein [Actinomycetota bacterium]|nr:FHA domain-containing protein [Actinomycetota bacterium]
MSVLKSLETKIAGLVEGAFGRAFRSEVRPVEIARKLAREMDEHRTVSVSRTYVPNEYGVYLSHEDRERFGDYEDVLLKELAGYLLEHARMEKLALLSRPRVEFRTDEALSLGEFGIQARLVRPPVDPEAPPSQGKTGHTMVYRAQREPEPLNPHVPAHLRRAMVVVSGKRMVVGAEGAVLGRSRDCDIVLDDANVSRHHAELRPSGDGWTIADMGSTNGVVINGQRAHGAAALRAGDEVELGTSTLRFELE